MEFWNEGTPYRCFGPHTHRKAPVEAQARFSEESCDTLSQDIRLLHTATHYRQAGYNSRNLISVATRLPPVNPFRRKKSLGHRTSAFASLFTTQPSNPCLENSVAVRGAIRIP